MHPSRLFAFFLVLIFPVIVKADPRSYSIVVKTNADEQYFRSGVIDNSGKLIIPCNYGQIEMDPAGYFRAKSATGISLFDGNGTLIFQSAAFMEIGNCGNELLPVQDKASQLWGYADLHGKIRIAPVYAAAKSFVSGIAVVFVPRAKKEKDTVTTWTESIINLDGKVLLDFSQCPQVHDINLFPFSDSLVSFTAQANAWSGYMSDADNEVQGFITMRGQLLKKNIFRTHSQFYAFPSAVASMPFVCPLPEERYCYCSPNGTIVIPGPFGRAYPFSSDGIAMVIDITGTYYIDLKGKRLYDASRYEVGERMPDGTNVHDMYDNNRIPLYDRKRDQTDYIDSRGRVVISLDSGMNGMDFHEGVALIWRYVDRKTYSYAWSRIDTTGKLLAPFDTVQGGLGRRLRYDDRPYVFFDAVSKHYGIRSTDDKILASPQWSSISRGEGVFLVWGGSATSRGPNPNNYNNTRSSGALSEKGVLITKGYYSFSDFTCFTAQEKNAPKIPTLNFTGKEMGEQIIDVLGIRADVEREREYFKKSEKKKEEEDGN